MVWMIWLLFMIKINDSKIKQTLKRVFREDAKCVSFLLDILKHMKECHDRM